MTIVLHLGTIGSAEYSQLSSEGSISKGSAGAAEGQWRPGLSTATDAGDFVCTIRGEVVQCQALCIGQNRLRLAFHSGICRHNHGGRSAAGWCSCRGRGRAAGRGGATG